MLPLSGSCIIKPPIETVLLPSFSELQSVWEHNLEAVREFYTINGSIISSSSSDSGALRIDISVPNVVGIIAPPLDGCIGATKP